MLRALAQGLYGYFISDVFVIFDAMIDIFTNRVSNVLCIFYYGKVLFTKVFRANVGMIDENLSHWQFSWFTLNII